MKTILVIFFWIVLGTNLSAQEISGEAMTAAYNGVSVLIRLKTEDSDTKTKYDYKVFRLQAEGKDELVFSLNDAENRAEWVYTDTLNLPDGIYVYRFELYAKGKLKTKESIIVNRFTPGLFPIISSFETSGNVGKQNIQLNWKTLNSARIRNMQLERKGSLENEFSIIAVLKPSDSTFIDSVTVPNEAYFYRFQMLDRVNNEFYQSATVHYVPTFDVVPDAIKELESEIANGFPTLKWQNRDEKTRGFYVYKLDYEVGNYVQSSLVLTGDSSGNYFWKDQQSTLKLGATYNYYVVAESHSYTKGKPSDTVSIYIPAEGLVMSPPQNLILLQSLDESFRLVWDIDSSRIDEIAFFEILRKKPNQTQFDTVNTIQVPYYLNFASINEPLNGEEFTIRSGNGNNLSANSIPFTYNAVFQNDFGPTYIKAEIVDDELWIKWNSPENNTIIGFKLYKWENENYNLIETMSNDITLVKTKNYLEGENNTFYITAIKADGKESSPSKLLTVF